MKLAIIGSGPLAIFCAQCFDQIGAEVTLFQKSALGGNVRFLIDHFPHMELNFRNQLKTIKSFWDEDLTSAILSIEEKGLTKAGNVLRVHKRFLQTDETIPGKSRLHDLFRVVYSVNPKEAILRQVEENPEMFKQLGEQVVDSLHLPVESFLDFDIVIEAQGLGREAQPMGPSNAMALNENNLRKSAELYYGKDLFTKLVLKGKTQLVLVGHSELAVLALLKYKEWLVSNPTHSLIWVTSERIDKKFENSWFNIELEKMLHTFQTIFDNEKVEFEKKMYEWRDLEEHIKTKIVKPIEPETRLNVYQGYNVTSVDRLLDRDGLFVTIESPDFRDYAKVSNDLKTIPTDAILIANGVNFADSVVKGNSDEEPGVYCLETNDPNKIFSQIKFIEEKILSFFSRVQ